MTLLPNKSAVLILKKNTKNVRLFSLPFDLITKETLNRSFYELFGKRIVSPSARGETN